MIQKNVRYSRIDGLSVELEVVGRKYRRSIKGSCAIRIRSANVVENFNQQSFVLRFLGYLSLNKKSSWKSVRVIADHWPRRMIYKA